MRSLNSWGFKQTPHIVDGDTIIIEEPVFSADTRMIHIEQMPDPCYDVNAFIAKNLVYPPYAYDNGIEGRVTFSL